MIDLVMRQLRVFFFFLCLSIVPVVEGQAQWVQQYTSGVIDRLEVTSDAALYASRPTDDSIESKRS